MNCISVGIVLGAYSARSDFLSLGGGVGGGIRGCKRGGLNIVFVH